MLTLGAAASIQTKQLIQQVLEVSSGTRKLESVDEVQLIQKKIATQAKDAQKAGRMSQKQVDALIEASRGHVSTGFGTCHEDAALDIYEKRVGCSVRERNEDLMEWRFDRVDVHNGETGVSAVPIGKAKRRRGWMAFMQEQTKQQAEQLESGHKIEPTVLKSNTKQSEPEQSNQVHVLTNEANTVKTESIETLHDTNDVSDLTAEKEPEPSLDDTPKKPFFKIVGAVDGIRDEIYEEPLATKLEKTSEFSDNEVEHDTQHDEFSDDDHNIILRPIVVECKHRMKKAQIPPPLYDQIQTCIYCQMHETEEADLIQVVRNQMKKPHQKEHNAKVSDNDNHIEVTISRISLNDPIHNHKYHWKATLLPRLASFVDAVYNIRKDDSKRYRMLIALVTCENEDADMDAEKEAWNILLEECPWLKHCDTAFGRKQT
jgi:hypothetical protein